MGKIALITVVGNKDKGVNLDKTKYQKNANLSFFRYLNSKDVSLHAFTNELKKLRLEPSEEVMDLLIIACSMYAADTRISRKEYAEDSWTRQIDLYIPVSNILLWNSQKSLLEKIFRFLSGDIWTINFRERTDKTLKLSPKITRKKYAMPYATDTVCLFSGGMDSFIGAIDLLSRGTVPLLVGHSKSSDVSPFQKKCETALTKSFPETPPKRIGAYIKIPKENLFKSDENSERGRSFLFLALGAICASSLKVKSKLVVPENGLISLNIPLTPLRIGSHSTRTTHPHYFKMMQEFFNGLKLGVEIINPYQLKTKGEMLEQCSNSKLVEKTETMSCSHPSGRYQGLGNIHCGYCVPCIIRQASFKKAKVKDNFAYRVNIFDPKGVMVSKAEGADIAAFKYMIEKVKKNSNYLTTAIRNTGPLGENVINYVDVYKRALLEVEDLLKKVYLK